jgi:predicted nucleotide-binding protein (sugar kinase/HSP70/actin superfamily)
MRVSFPRFGYDTPALTAFVEDLGADVVLPPANSKRTMELGVVHSPELICLPFKITLGNFIEAVERGADTLLMPAGARKCRFGYYHYLQDRVLRDMGCDCRLVPITQYSPYQFFFRAMPSLFSVSPTRVIRATALMLAKSKLTQEFRELLNRKRAVDFEAGEKLKPRALALVERAKSVSEVQRARLRLRRAFNLNGGKPELRLGLVGEIYLTIEQFANGDIEKELARMGAEVLFERSLYHHIRHLLHVSPGSAQTQRRARRYLEECPGGEAMRTVGEAMRFAEDGVDGIVHIFPFTCMPENVALEALGCIAEETGVPVLSLSFDEHASRTGLLTRLEAFVDVVKRRKSGRRLHRD